MEALDKTVIGRLLNISLVFVVLPLLYMLLRGIWNRYAPVRKKQPVISPLLVFSGFLIGAIWCLRYAVGCYLIAVKESTLTETEEIFNSIVHTLQTFSMDEDYTEYIKNGKGLVTALFDKDSRWLDIYGIYTAFLNTAAPIAGGAVIFEILASIFPRVRLYLCHLCVWKEKYYFSELNAASLAVVKSVHQEKFPIFRRPVMIFTDAYVDDESEQSAELLLQAKAYGAVCVRDDIVHVTKNRWGCRKLFLVDEKEIDNLKCFAQLATKECRRYLRGAEVYLFSQNDTYNQVEQRLLEELKNEKSLLACIKNRFLAGKTGKISEKLLHLAEKCLDKRLPTVRPVQRYRNMISRLLVDVPLYEPLIGRPKNQEGTRDLHVAILGTGDIGTEMFLSAYWMCQMADCMTHIHVVSQDSEEAFWNKIDMVNPEIRHTTAYTDPILCYNPSGKCTQPYCLVHYTQCDAQSTEFVKLLDREEGALSRADYILVALGSDEVNITVANTLCRTLGSRHLLSAEDEKTVIAYVVYDSELAKALNRKKRYSFGSRSASIYMQAVGDVDELYSVGNIFMSDQATKAARIHKAYLSVQDRLICGKNSGEKHKKRGNTLDDDYKYWANLSRALHQKYKAFSLGLARCSVFDTEEKAYREAQDAMLVQYEQFAVQPDRTPADAQAKHALAWLEHRRWNAFMRIKGFRHTGDYQVYGSRDIPGSYKQMELQLHPCLVECDPYGIRPVVPISADSRDKVTVSTVEREYDYLDILSAELYEKGWNNYDFKLYDYPFEDCDPDILRSQTPKGKEESYEKQPVYTQTH